MTRKLPPMLTAATAFASLFGGYTSASAAIINISDGNGLDYRAEDDNESGVANGIVDSSTLLAGDSSNNNKVFASIFEFDISGSAAEIAAASKIEFVITVDTRLGAGAPTGGGTFDGTLSFVALDSTAENGVASNADYNASSTLVSSVAAGSFNASDTITIDVTSFVKADSDLAQNFSGFRLQVPVLVGGNNDNNAADALQFAQSSIGGELFSDARLVTTNPIPEPASIALLAIGTLALLPRRRS